jgi:hypothetical protein
MKETCHSDRRFWCSYILFIIIIGGILVLFIYITRLASDEIFSPSNKIHREVGRAKDLSAPRCVLRVYSVTLNITNRPTIRLVNKTLESILKEAVLAWSDVLSLHFFCSCRAKSRNHQHSYCPGRDSNLVPPQIQFRNVTCCAILFHETLFWKYYIRLADQYIYEYQTAGDTVIIRGCMICTLRQLVFRFWYDSHLVGQDLHIDEDSWSHTTTRHSR